MKNNIPILLILSLFLFFSCKKETAKTTEETTVTDIDGNIYNTIRIGTQVWMKENLKTSRYNTGSTNLIAAQNNTDWINSNTNKTPSWCYYDGEVTNNANYGKLYNWYAVNSGNLAPFGWHIPTKAEWTTLISYLGNESVAGGKMKATTLWNSPNTGATNSSGFTGLPGGVRSNETGVSQTKGNNGYFWTSTETTMAAPITTAESISLLYNQSQVFTTSEFKGQGLSVRCIKD